MKLGKRVHLGPGHVVLDGDPAPPPPKGGEAPNFRPISVVAKWLVDHDETWHAVRIGLGPGHIVLDGDPAPPPPKGGSIFGPYLLQPNGWMDQDATWYRGRP